jgi:hypothetical protein
MTMPHHASGDALDVRNFAAAERYCIYEASLLLFCCPCGFERTEGVRKAMRAETLALTKVMAVLTMGKLQSKAGF